MKQYFNQEAKGNNICQKFTSTQYARNAIYSSVETVLSTLNQQQQKLKGVFEYTLSGLGKALESSNTGWTIDSSFKQGEDIRPQTVLPTISSETVEALTETWNYTNQISTHNYYKGPSMSIKRASEIIYVDNNNIWIANNYPLSGNKKFAIQISQIDMNGRVIKQHQCTLQNMDDPSGSNTSWLIPLALGAYLDDDSHIQVKIFGICENVKVSGTSYYFFYKELDWTSLSSSNEIQYLNPITFNNFTPQFSGSTPLVRAKYDDYTQHIYFVALNTSLIIYYGKSPLINTQTSWNLVNLNVYCYLPPEFYIDFSGTYIYLLNRTSTYYGYLYQFTREQNTALSNDQKLQSIYLSNGDSDHLHYMGLTKDLENWVVCIFNNNNLAVKGGKITHPAIRDIDLQLYVNSHRYVICIGYTQLYVAYTSQQAEQTEQFICSSLDLTNNEVNSYSRIVPDIAIAEMVYTNALYIVGTKNTNIVQFSLDIISNQKLQSYLIEKEDDTPLSCFINCSHVGGAKIQLRCIYNSKPLQLFDNNGIQLYGNDLGIVYKSPDLEYEFSTTEPEKTLPAYHICVRNNNTYVSGLCLTEILLQENLGILNYHIVVNKNGNFIGLIVSNTDGVIANIGCGDLISELQYSDDVSAQKRTVYYSLGFVQENLTPVPSEASLQDNFTVAFVAPTYQGNRFYGGQNNDESKDLLYYAKGVKYTYYPEIATESYAYTMPILLGIEGTNKVYYFNDESAVKGLLNRCFLVAVSNIDTDTATIGKTLDYGNYLYVGKNLAIGWDASNTKEVNPYYQGE